MELIKNISSSQILKKIFLAIIGSILIAISSKIKIPFYPVPMTMQTFVVVLIGILYGWKLGVFTVSLDLFQGARGLPVFAGERNSTRLTSSQTCALPISCEYW